MEIPVKSFMSGDPVWITADASALEAFERMLDRGIRHLPVLDGERRVVGVLSIDDLRAALPYSAALNQPLAPLEREVAREWQVGEIMSHDPVTLGPDATLGEAAACMAERRIGCLAIVDETGRLAGLLSETDVLWAVANSGALRKAAAPATAPDVLDALVRELSQERERVRKRLSQEHRVREVDRVGSARSAARHGRTRRRRDADAGVDRARRAGAAPARRDRPGARPRRAGPARQLHPLRQRHPDPATARTARDDAVHRLCAQRAGSEPAVAVARARPSGPRGANAPARAPRRRAPRRGSAPRSRGRGARRRRARPRRRRRALPTPRAVRAAARSTRAAARAGPS